MIVKNGYSISFGDSRRGVYLSNTSRGSSLNTPKKKRTISNVPPPPEPDSSDITCLNLTAGLYKKKYEGYFNDVNEFFDSKLVSAISYADLGKSYQILDIGTSTQQDWYNWGFIESPQYDTTEALGLPFPSIGKGVSYFGGGPIENAGTANLGPVLVSESVSSQIDDNYSQSQGQNNKSLIIKGYFKPTVNGVYKFRLYSDDASYLWFGNDALDGNRTTANAVVSLPGIHGPYHTDPPGTFTMVANSYYPLTVEFGNGPDGEGVLIFDYMPPGSDTWTSDLAGKLFYDTTSKGHRSCLAACVSDWTHVNFNGTTFRNGDPIPQIEDTTDWANATGPAWCYYDNDSANGNTYGKLYNWHAVNDPRGLAPEGYHIPSLEEWNYIITCLGGINIAGGRMKVEGSNESMFSAKLGGVRSSGGGFTLMNSRGSFWTSTDGNSPPVINFNVGANNIYIGPDGKTAGYSIRLMQGNLPTPPNIDNMFFPSLWLDASTGINKFDYNYISQIVLSGNPSVSGIYNASSVPTYNFGEERPNDYSLGNISYSDPDDGHRYRIITENLNNSDIGYESFDGVNWSTFNSYTSQLIITGFTGAYTNANGTYNLSNDNPSDSAYSNGPYQLFENQLQSLNQGYLVVASKNNDGSFTPTSYVNQITISNAGSPSANGVYTRTSEGNTNFTSPVGSTSTLTFDEDDGPNITIFRLDGDNNVDDGDGNISVVRQNLYRIIIIEDNIIYLNQHEGALLNGQLPTAVAQTAPKLMGDGRISSTISSPNGSITGTITTSNVATNLLTSWEDQSLNGNDATAYSGPELITNTLNSKPVLRFDGSPQSMTLTSNIGGPQYTIFIVCKNNDNEKGSMYLWNPDDGYEKYIGVITDANYNSDARNKFILSEYDAGDGQEGSHLAWSSSTINNDFFIGTALRNGGGKAYLNGSGGVDGMGVFDYQSNTFNSIGGYGNGFDIDGDIAEIISYNRALTTSERQEVESYLMEKYAITPAPSGIPYSSTASVSIDVINFTLSKENDYGDGNLLYSFDQSENTPPRPANYYGYSVWDYDTGVGSRAILAFNTSATTYYSNQPSFAPDFSLPQNAWILIVFTAGTYDDGSTPPVPTSVYVNNSSGQSASTIPTTGWSPSITITAA